MQLFRKSVFALGALLASVSIACSQSSPNLYNGQVPTAAQWNSYFAAKQDVNSMLTGIATGIINPNPGTFGDASHCVTITANTSGLVTGLSEQLCAGGGGGGGSPGGATAQIQYNAAGAFGGISGFTSNGTTTTFADGALNISGLTSGSSVLKAPATGGGTATLFPGTDTIVGLNATQILTNKTLTSPILTSPSFSTIVNTGTLTLPTATDTLVGRATTDTFSNKTISGATNTLTNIGNSSLSNSSVTIGSTAVSLGGTAATINGLTLGGTTTFGSITGSTQCLHVNSSGVLSGTGADCGAGGGGVTTFNTRSGAVVPAAGDYSAIVETLTNKTISGASNTLTNISNASLSNSSVTIGSTSVNLGSTASTVTALTLSGGTLSGTTTFSGITGSTQCLHVNSSGVLSGTGADCGAGGGGSGTVTSIGLGAGLCSSTTNPITTTGTISWCQTLRANTATTDTILSSDGGKVYTTSNAASQAITLPTVGTSGFGSGFGFNIDTIGAGAATLSSTSNIDNLGAITLTTGQGASIFSDGTTYHAIVGLPQLANNRFFGNNSGSTSYGNAMTGTQATALLDTFTSTLKGLAPASGGGTTNFLRADGTWAAPAGGGSGCSTSGSQFQLLIVNAAGTGCDANANATANAGSLTLGASGTLGQITLGNATSGTINIRPVTGALGTVTASLPANTGTIAELNLTQTWTAAQRNNVVTVSPVSNTYTPNFDGSNNFSLTLAATNTIANPSTTPVAGQSGIIEIIQDATGSRTVTWGSQYVAAGGVSTVTLSTAANAKDYISYYVVDATHILISVGALNATH